MRPPLAPFLAVLALAASGCAGQAAAIEQPTVEVAETPAPDPRPTASEGLKPRGPAEAVSSVDTKDKVVFLTIDDGLVNDPQLLSYLDRKGIPVTVFLTTGTVTDWQYWNDMTAVGSIQNHSVRHPDLTTLGASGAEAEICAANDAIVEKTGETPWMLRPPYGSYDASTLAVAGNCGLDYAVHWTVSLPGDKLQYQSVGASLEPGDIILTHFRDDLRSVLPKVVKDVRSQGFEIGRLEEYLTPRGWDKKPEEIDAEMATETESRAVLVQN